MPQEVWERIPPDSDVVLYFGCSEGSKVDALRQRYPKMTVVGVEQNAALREQAHQKDFLVLEDAAAALAYLRETGLKADAWILERGAWQDETLTRSCRRQILEFLRPGAALAWEFASSQYWQYLLSLISGKTDGTVRHCLKDIASELESDGVSGVEIFVGAMEESQREFAQCMELLKPLADAMKIPSQKREALFGADTLILRGWFQEQGTEPLVIKTVYGETLVCARVRIDEPHSFLTTLPHLTCKRVKVMNELELRGSNRLLWIWQRRMFDFDSMVNAQRLLLERHALTIQEWDDDPLHWEEHFNRSRFVELRGSHAIQTSTPALAEYLKQFNPEVRIFPNCIATLPPLRFDENPAVTVFFGALNRDDDWAPIMPELNKVLRRQGKKVRLIVVFDQKFFDAAECEQKEFFPFCEYPQYQKLLLQSDIALLPLLPTRFNQMKSDLKFLECAAWGTTVLASPTVYADTVRHGETGLLYATEEQFRLGLEQLIEDTVLRQRLAENAWQWVKENRLLSLHYRDRLHWYDSLFSRYDELTAAIENRVPEMRRGSR